MAEKSHKKPGFDPGEAKKNKKKPKLVIKGGSNASSKVATPKPKGGTVTTSEDWWSTYPDKAFVIGPGSAKKVRNRLITLPVGKKPKKKPR
jgi:hypothetical protein